MSAAAEAQIYDNLYSKLKTRQANFSHVNKYSGISVYLYTINEAAPGAIACIPATSISRTIEAAGKEISKDFIKFDSINTLSNEIQVSRATIQRYLNTNVPYKNQLFFNWTYYWFQSNLRSNVYC
jgi:hypothetical protein